jgi:PAS domain S-box-containing protein
VVCPAAHTDRYMSAMNSSNLSASRWARVAALIGVAVVCVFVARLRWSSLERGAIEYWRGRMDASAEATRDAIQAWLEARQADERILAEQAAAHKDALGGSKADKHRRELQSVLTATASERGYAGIWAVDASGRVLAHSLDAPQLDTMARAAALEATRNGMSPIVGPVLAPDKRVELVIATPIFGDRTGRRIGAIVISLDPYRQLFPMVMRDPSGIVTAHHRLVARLGDEYVVLTPSLAPDAGPLVLHTRWTDAPVLAARAIGGRDSTGSFTEFDGQRVVAASRHIAEAHWGIVRSIGETEALEGARAEFHVELILAIAALALVVAGLTVWRRQARTTQLRVLAESEARYRLLAENATDMIIRQAPTGAYQYVSPACRALRGYEPGELIALDPLELFHPDDPPPGVFREEALSSRGAVTASYRMRRKDGVYAWFETTSRAVHDERTAAVQELVTVSREITARKRAEEQAARLARSNELLLACAGEGIFGIDMSGRITFINPAGAGMLGRDAVDLLGLDEHAAIHHSRADGSAYPDALCAVCASTRAMCSGAPMARPSRSST